MNKENYLLIQRKVSREVFLKFIYQIAVNKDNWENLLSKLNDYIGQTEEHILSIHNTHGGRTIEENEIFRDIVIDSSYLMDMCEEIENHINDIDELINKFAKNWSVNTLPVIDLSILRLSICEIKYIYTIPKEVSCDEAVNLAKLYCDDKSYKYINGILGSIIDLEK